MFLASVTDEEKVQEVIVMVRKVIMNNLEKAREEAEVVLEEAGNEDLESMAVVAETMLVQKGSQNTLSMENTSISNGNEFLIHSTIHPDLKYTEEQPPSKRRKKAQPRKLQITNDSGENDLGENRSKKRKKV